MSGAVGTALAYTLLEEQGVSAALRVSDSDVSVDTGRVLFGLDTTGRHLLVPMPSPADLAEDRSSLGVQIRARMAPAQPAGPPCYLDVVCLRPSLRGVFTTFVDHLLQELRSGPDHPDRVVPEVLRHWRELLRPERGARLSEAELVGLIGELECLRGLAEHDPEQALSAWCGWRGERWDFHRAGHAIEVKSTTAAVARMVWIHGLGQLDTSDGTALVLHLRRYTRDDQGSGIADLLAQLADRGVDELEVRRRLTNAGWDAADTQQPRFALIEDCSWRVDDEFPRLTPDSLAPPGPPPQITTVQYGLDLSVPPPLPLLPEEYLAHTRELVRS